ncbi:tetratricopeptide repeat containing [Trichuris trichiura]|uniref:Tetratricopeptide repeat containing n=1 Tax=Trichuris trichiura TaxID=36087 RepID=A0A077YWV6_TRITR|nr:tetratricopeptide repeat containing [Trichuris trichiura]
MVGIVATVKSFFHSTKEDVERKKIADIIREAILSYRNGNAPQSIDLLHKALSDANESGDEKAVNYITDLLANIYYELMDTVKAKALFLSLTDRLIGSGTKETDPTIVEISADLNAQKDELSDPYALYGMILETYSRYLMSRKRVEDSKKHFNRALELARDIYSPLSAHVIIMMNNYAIECVKQGEYELARGYHSEVVYRAVHCQDLEWQLPAFYCNYAETLWHCGQKKEALEMAERALSLAASGDKNVLKHVKEFCDSLRKEMNKSSSGGSK